MQQRAQEAKIEDRSRVLRPFSEQSKRELVLSLVCVIGLPGHGLLTSRTKSANIECLFSLLQSKFRYEDRKSTRLNSSHITISYAVFCLKKKKTTKVILPKAMFRLLEIVVEPLVVIEIIVPQIVVRRPVPLDRPRLSFKCELTYVIVPRF